MSPRPAPTRPNARETLAASGVPALTGWPDGPPVVPPPAFAGRLDALVDDIASRTAAGGEAVLLDWGRVLTGRAAVLGWRRAGVVSANGTCRLMRSSDGWVAVSLARPEDRAAVPALLAPAGVAPHAVDPLDPWCALASGARRMSGSAMEQQGALLGLPVGVLRRPALEQAPVRTEHRWEKGAAAKAPAHIENLRVVDMSAMWAGPLAARILAAAGAEVVKVELAGRTDGARATPAFYRWLHDEGQEVLTVDPRSAPGRSHLRALVGTADVVIESSRPRALAALDAGADDLPARAARVWLSITGHGRAGSAADRVGFGDDAAVAGGLVGWDAGGQPVFLADAVADPVTGMVAAAAVLQAVASGGGVLLDVGLSSVAAWLARGKSWGCAVADPSVARGQAGGWDLCDRTGKSPVQCPVVRAPVDAPHSQ